MKVLFALLSFFIFFSGLFIWVSFKGLWLGFHLGLWLVISGIVFGLLSIIFRGRYE